MGKTTTEIFNSCFRKIQIIHPYRKTKNGDDEPSLPYHLEQLLVYIISILLESHTDFEKMVEYRKKVLPYRTRKKSQNDGKSKNSCAAPLFRSISHTKTNNFFVFSSVLQFVRDGARKNSHICARLHTKSNDDKFELCPSRQSPFSSNDNYTYSNQYIIIISPIF